MNRKSLFGTASAVLAVWFALGVSAAASAAVLKPGDNIQTAIDSAAAGGTIELGEGTFEISSQLMLSDGKKLVGQGWAKTTIKMVAGLSSGAQSDTTRCVTLNGGARLERVTLTGGHLRKTWASGAGALVNDGTISWCRIIGNQVGDATWMNVTVNNIHGGGVAFPENGKGQIDHSIIADNAAYMNGGGESYGGGIGVLMPSGEILIDTCLIYGNRTSNDGGGIHAQFDDKHKLLTIRNTTIANNTANGAGGGIYVKQHVGSPNYDLKLLNTVVADNVSGSGDANLALPTNDDRLPAGYAAQSSGNVFANGTASLGDGSKSIAGSGSDWFVASGSGDYHLVANADPVDAGKTYSGIGSDLDGNDFVSTPSAGCYQYGSSAGGPVIDSGAFSSYLAFKASGYAGTEALEEFPVLVRLSENSPEGFTYASCAADGSDIRFADDDEHLIAHEIDTWNPSGESLIWVNIPKLTSSTQFTMYFGGDGSAPTLPASSVWTRAGYHFVNHNNVTATTVGMDSTGSGLVAVPYRDPLVVSAPAGAPMGMVDDQTGSNNYGWDVANDSKWAAHGGHVTMTLWSCRVKGNDKTRALMGVNNRYGMVHDPTANNKAWLQYGATKVVEATLPYAVDQWTHFAGAIDETDYRFYQNGELLGSETSTAIDSVTEKLSCGSQNVNGGNRNYSYLDEYRLRWAASSADWVKAEYDTVMKSDFLTLAPPDPDLPKLAQCEADVNEYGNIIVSGLVSRHAGEVEITLSAKGELPIVVSLGEVAAGEEFEREFGEDDGLVRFAEYTVSVTVSNGGKVAQKTFPDPVKYGKVQASDRYEFTVTPSPAVKDLLGSDTYTDYPVLVRVPSVALQVVESGREIRVTDESGAELPWELESIDDDGRALVWVKVPALTASTKLTVCTGGGDNPDNDSTEVWSDYVGVWHLDEAKDTTTPNSYGEYTNSTSTVGINGNLAQYSMADEPGIVGKSFRVNDVTTSQKGNFNYGGVWVPGTSDLKLGSNFTISGWFKMAANAFYYDHVFYKRSRSDNGGTPNGAFAIEISSSNNKTFRIDARGVNTSVTAVNVSGADPFSDWVYLTFVYNGTKCSVYANDVKAGDVTINAVTDNDAALAFGNNCNIAAGSVGDAAWCGWIDEVRLASGSRTEDRIKMDYRMVTDAGFFDYTEPHLVDPTAPKLSAPEIVGNDNGTFTVTVMIDDNMPEEGSVEIVYNGTKIPMTTEDTAVPATYTAVLTPVEEDVTDILEVRARSASGIGYVVISPGFYSGELRIEKVRDANEMGLSAGVWRISREDSAYDLNVSLVKLDTSTAVAGVDYIEFPLNTVISNGMSYVDVSVTPLMNLALEEDTWIDLAITNGSYRIDPAWSASRLVIKNYEIPTDANIWTGQTSSKASVGSNWTLGVAPDELSAVVFDGDLSKVDCEWDADAPHTVRSWMQKENYTGTVTFTTQYPASGSSFQVFEVSGDCFVSGGKWTHPVSVNLDNNGKVHTIDELRAKYTYRLCVRVGGDFVLGPAAKVDLVAKGHSQKKRTGNVVALIPAHGGRFSDSTCGCYGNVKYPEDIGYAGNLGTDNADKCAAGGGAFKLTVAKKATIDGEISVNGEASSGNLTASAAGSVLIEAADISGSGKIYAQGVSCGNSSYSNGCGGRIALIASGTLDSSRLDVNAGASSQNGKRGAVGTVFLKDSSMPNGTLCVRNPDDKTSNASPGRGVAVSEEGDWTFDAVVLEGNAVIHVVPGSRLTLVNGFYSVSAPGNANRYSGIFYNGGELDVGTGTQTLSGNWYFCPAKEFVFPGNLGLMNGAAIGFSSYWEGPALANKAYPNDPWTVRFRVEGSMSLDEGTEVTAYSAGNCQDSNGVPEGMSIGNHGGRISMTGVTTDSVFFPHLGCLYQSNSYGYVKGAGVIDFSVGGSLTMNGTINAKGISSNDSQRKLGGPGSINITAGSLTGTGSILATATEAVQAGGRIAIRLTDEDADFSGFRGKISAAGGGNASTSAGSVYLQTGADRELSGTVRIDNGGYSGGVYTPVCATGYAADGYQDFKDAVLELSQAGYAQISACDDDNAFTMRALKIDKLSMLDLNGKDFTVRLAHVNGIKVSVGTYRAGDYPFDNALIDSVGNGRLRVTGYGLWVFIQ